jgi:hypothetical protein
VSLVVVIVVILLSGGKIPSENFHLFRVLGERSS